MTYSIVGVTGHIDHGKTTLVRVLTGVDTDTLPEEKRRGITIDLGFATFQEEEHRFALIDAPGHQKYIGNLLAGVSAIDIGMLVVACDQGIQEQTLEHAAVVKALGVRNLIVVISRIDLVNDSAVHELSEELEVFLADFGFDEIPIVPISSVTGVGIDRLKSLLCEYARRSETTTNQSSNLATQDFRLPIDRVFTIPGRGLVVAGTIWSGEVRIGDMLEIAGSNEKLRVRELEVHGENVESSRAGCRTAINLAGAGSFECTRGDELVTPGSHAKSELLVVCLEMFPDAIEMRCPATVQLHSATQSCSARILGPRKLLPGSSAVVVVQPERGIVATYMQACLFRLPYPVGSLAGGRILAAMSSDHIEHVRTRSLVELGNRLKGASANERLMAWVDFLGELDENSAWCETHLGIPRDNFSEAVKPIIENKQAIKFGNRLVSVSGAQRARQFILKIVKERTQGTDDAWLAEKSIVQRARSVGSPELVAWVIDQLVGENLLVRLNNLVAMATEQTALSKKQRASMEQIIGLFDGTRSPPTLKEIVGQLRLSSESVSSLMRFATQQRVLLDLGDGFYISTRVFQVLCGELDALFSRERELPVATIRDTWQVTRKHAIPLLEYCDREKITIRHDNLRTAGPRLSQLCAHETPVESAIEQI